MKEREVVRATALAGLKNAARAGAALIRGKVEPGTTHEPRPWSRRQPKLQVRYDGRRDGLAVSVADSSRAAGCLPRRILEAQTDTPRAHKSTPVSPEGREQSGNMSRSTPAGAP